MLCCPVLVILSGVFFGRTLAHSSLPLIFSPSPFVHYRFTILAWSQPDSLTSMRGVREGVSPALALVSLLHFTIVLYPLQPCLGRPLRILSPFSWSPVSQNYSIRRLSPFFRFAWPILWFPVPNHLGFTLRRLPPFSNPLKPPSSMQTFSS